METRDLQIPQETIAFLRGVGNSSFDPQSYLKGTFGDRQRMLLSVDAGKLPGVRIEDHDEYGGWTAYLPDVAGEDKLPLLIGVYNATVPRKEMEKLGFASVVSSGGLIHITVGDGNNADAVVSVLDRALELYPIDRNRVFIAGHSFGGSSAARSALKYPERFAGVCMLGTQYYFADSTQEEIDRAARSGMAVAMVCGTNEVNGVFPINRDPERPAPPRVYADVTPPYLSAENCLSGLNRWRTIAGCAVRSREEDTNDLSEAEQKIGAHFASAAVREMLGRSHYIGEEANASGEKTLRCCAVDGGPHCVAPTAAQIVWEFFSTFARDGETGKLVRRRPKKAYRRVAAETTFAPLGQVVTALRYELEEGVDTQALSPMDFTVYAFSDMKPVAHEKHVIGIDRSTPGTLTLLTEEFLLDARVPRFGLMNGHPGSVFVGEFEVFCSRTVGGMSLDLTRSDLVKTEPAFAKKFIPKRFEREGMMGFDYVEYRAKGENLPVVFYSVGSGADNNAANNQQILNYGACLMASEAFQSVYPCHIIAPWFPMPGHPPQGAQGNAKMEEYGCSTAELVRSFSAEVGADRSRLYFIGTGGGALYQHLAAGKDLYAAAAMMTSVFDYFNDGSEIPYLKEIIGIPLYISHAQSDYPCPVRRSRLACDKLREFGHRNLYYYEYSDEELARGGIDPSNLAGTHDSPNLNLAKPEFYRWLFSQKRNI